MIRDLNDVDLAQGLNLIYETVAAGIVAGILVGVAAVWISVAVRGGDAS